MRPGVRLGVDVGTVRVGVARSNPAGTLAVPVQTVRRARGDQAVLAALVGEFEVIEVVVGLPRTLAGAEGKSARDARHFAGRLARRVAPVPVRLLDERLTTVTAQTDLRAGGVRARDQRSVVDQAAAVVLLQAAIDTERLTGRPAGERVPAR